MSDGTKRAAWETNSELAEKKIQFISIFFDHQCCIFQNKKLKYYCNQSLKLLTLSQLDRASDRSLRKKSNFASSVVLPY